MGFAGAAGTCQTPSIGTHGDGALLGAKGRKAACNAERNIPSERMRRNRQQDGVRDWRPVARVAPVAAGVPALLKASFRSGCGKSRFLL